MRTFDAVLRGMKRITSNGTRHRSMLTRTMNRVVPLLEKQLCVDVRPEELFGEDACVMEGQPRKVFFVANHDSEEVIVKQADPQRIAERMVFSLQEEMSNFLSYYRKYRFAFPEARSEIVEQSQQLQRVALDRVLEGKDCYEVYHPYPVSIPRLFEAVEPYVG